jgi:CRP-like cAMP-binding protein
MLNGWAGWVRMLPDGRRQILRLLLPGDVGPSARGVTPDCAVVALTRSRTAVIGLADAPDLPRRQRIAEALRRLAQEEEADLFGQLVRLGRLSAYERTAHLMLSLFMRLQRAGEASGDTMDMPLTQEVLGDVLGLSVVHVNRTLKQLREEGLIVCRGGKTRVPAPEALAAACGSEVGLGSPLASARRYAAARPVESGSWHGAAQPS